MQIDPNMASPMMAADVVDMMSRLPASAASAAGLEFGAAPRQGRQLPDRILVAVHQACDLGELDIARKLLSILEDFVSSKSRRPIDPALRRLLGSMVAVHQRLWYLRHPAEAIREVPSVPLLRGSAG